MGSVGFFGGRRLPPKNENEFSRFLLEKKVPEGFLAAEGRQKKKNQRISAFLSIFSPAAHWYEPTESKTTASNFSKPTEPIRKPTEPYENY